MLGSPLGELVGRPTEHLLDCRKNGVSGFRRVDRHLHEELDTIFVIALITPLLPRFFLPEHRGIRYT